MSEQTEPLPGSLPFGAPAAGALDPAPGEPDLLSKLEARVTRLVERYRESKAALEDLEARLEERETQIAELRSRVETLGRARGTALERLDAVIREIEQIEKGEGTPA